MELRKISALPLLFCVFLFSVTVTTAALRHGQWSGLFFLNDSVEMPFRFAVNDSGFVFINGSERIVASDIRYIADSVFVTMPVFDSEFRFRRGNDSLSGIFINNSRLHNKLIKASAVYGNTPPLVNDFELKNFSGRWSVVFLGDDPPLNVAVAEFSQTGNHLLGTFLTPTGDYRFLEGFATTSHSFYLSAFDGSHVFYFTAALDENDTLRGHYFSGTHWHDTWNAWKDDNAVLPNPDSLSFLKDGVTKISFTFPDADSNVISLDDPRFKNKVTIVQIMGSWCPNCMDESAFLVPLYEKNKMRGFEIIGLDFERSPDFQRAEPLIKKFSKQLNISYPVLFAGSSDRSVRSNALPQLKSIVGFPTTLFIDRKGVVRKIHTGFNGPATGKYYEAEKDAIVKMVEMLLNE